MIAILVTPSYAFDAGGRSAIRILDVIDHAVDRSRIRGRTFYFDPAANLFEHLGGVEVRSVRHY